MAKRKRRRVQLGSSPEEHAKLAKASRAKALFALGTARKSARSHQCTLAIGSLAEGERHAGMAFADARHHVAGLEPYSKLLQLAEDVREDVMHACARRRGE